MFGFIKRSFLTGIIFLSTLTSVNLLFCISVNNQECKEPVLFPFSIKTSKCSGSCNNISNAYVQFCVLDIVKNLNVKVFNLISRANKTRHIAWHEMCKFKCRLDASVCNNKQRWKNDKCKFECKEILIRLHVVQDQF